MDILSFKRWFETVMQPGAPEIDVAAAWKVFGESLAIYPEQERCEEFSFGAGIQAGYVAGKLVKNERIFQVYFGRLIDASDGQSWRTAEINCYFNFAMSADFQHLLENLAELNIEAAYCLAEGEEPARRKRAAFLAEVEAQSHWWDAIRRQPVLQRDIQCTIF